MTVSVEQLRALALPADTTAEAASMQRDVYRRMSPEKRLLLALEMNDTARELSAAGVRAHHPEYDAEEIRLAVIRMCLGNELFAKAFAAKKSAP